MVDVISDFKVSADLVVADELYLTVDVNNTEVVSGSTICGATAATLYGFNLLTISVFVVSVIVEPEAALIPMFTIPYLGVSSSSPPQALTDNAFG